MDNVSQGDPARDLGASAHGAMTALPCTETRRIETGDMTVLPQGGSFFPDRIFGIRARQFFP